jgi:hypothetical protein
MKVFLIFVVSSLEFIGRLAKVGYASLEMGLISLDVIKV